MNVANFFGPYMTSRTFLATVPAEFAAAISFCIGLARRVGTSLAGRPVVDEHPSRE